MTLLAGLQQPLPANAPAVFATSAWSDLQLWTQLGAWAEQRHTWAPHAKPNEEVSGIAEPPPGIVAPYPSFFAGLAKLSRQTALAFQSNGIVEPFDPKRVAVDLLKAQELSKQIQDEIRSGKRAFNEPASDEIEVVLRRFSRFAEAYREKPPP